MKQRFRPQRSVSLLQGIIRIAMISRKSVIAVWMPFTVVSRSSLMSLIITFMFEPAKLQMNCARASGMSTVRSAADSRSLDERRVVELVVELDRRVDEGQMRERLGEVAELLTGEADLLGEQAD